MHNLFPTVSIMNSIKQVQNKN